MLLYTVQPKRRARGESSVADRTGLSDYLGYQPMFCTPVSEDSLGDFWFRAWSASPRCPERILLIETDEATPVPMDAIEWTNSMGMHERGSATGSPIDFSRILHEGDPIATDYLLPPDGKGYGIREVPVWMDGNALSWVDAFGRDAPVMRDRMTGIRDACVGKIVSGAVACDGHVNFSVTCEAMYAMMTYSAMMPMLWSLMTGRRLLPQVLWIVPQTFERHYAAIDRAQMARQAWDDSIANHTEMDIHLMRLMRREFDSAVAATLASVVSDYATAQSRGFESTCPCGSGRSVRACHGRVKSVDDAILG